MSDKSTVIHISNAESPPLFTDNQKDSLRHTLLFSFQCIGIVYGRLSIAPLYAFGTISHQDIKSDAILYEHFSFVFWTMTIIPLLKYACIVLNSDDNGEGGTFALYSLLCRHAKVGLLPNDTCDESMKCETKNGSKSKSDSMTTIRAIGKHKKGSHYCMLFMALFGSCMIICDGVLTPAISVLSASSGLERLLSDLSHTIFSLQTTQESISKALNKYVPVPGACAILICLFTLQRYGSTKIGSIFAPFVAIWLFMITGVGLYNIVHWNPKILYAISPIYMYRFLKDMNTKSWRSLSSILLCVAGSEAMFANLGHFSRKSIKMTFICFIYPALIVCYAGQSAFISKNWLLSKDAVHLSESVPRSVRHVFIILSLIVSAIGSQSSITASFSIIQQCLALGCFPRVKVIHTSEKIRGQIYIPDVNWILMVLSLVITIGFGDVIQIGSAAALTLVLGMLLTTCLMSLVLIVYWEKSFLLSSCFFIFFSFMEIMYLSACILNFKKGAWYLLLLLATLMTTMLSWHYGTMKKYEFDLHNKVSMDWLTDISPTLGVLRVPGIGFIYTDIVTGIPAFFSHFITNLPAFHQVLIFVSFKPLGVPFVPHSQRYLIGRVGPRDYKIYRCIVRYGYCDLTRDTDGFEDHIIRSIGEFISAQENDMQSLTGPEGKMIVVGANNNNNNNNNKICHFSSRHKKVRFALPLPSPDLQVREEFQYLVDARERGISYFLGQSHLLVREHSTILKHLMIKIYVFLDKNCRSPTIALNIPHAALVEVGMVYSI